MTLGTSLPFGLRDVKIIPYPNLAADSFGTDLIDLPNSQTFSFKDTEDYTELRGDDKLVTSHGNGSQLDWELDSGGLSLEAYAAIAGGEIIETGITPNQVKRYRKLVTDQRPFFALVGKAISDSGGDLWCVVYLARATGDIEGEMGDGEFVTPGASGTGFPCRVTGDVDGAEIFDALYDFVQHETITDIVAPVLDTPALSVVSSLSDVAGAAAGGELVMVTGWGFTGVTAVKFATTDATDYEVLSSTKIAAIAPAHSAGATNVRVTTAAGQSATGAGNVYTYS